MRADDEAITAEWTSDDARARYSMVSTAIKGGGEGEDRDSLSVYLVQGKQPLCTTGQKLSQYLYASISSQRPNKYTKGALHSANADGDASMHHLRKIGASSLYYSHCPPKHAKVEESFLTDDKYNHQRQDFFRTDCKEPSTLPYKENTSETTTIRTKYQLPTANKKRYVVKEEKSGPSGDSLEVGMELTVKSPVGSFKSGLSIPMWWIHILIALAVASTDRRMMISADAAFAPTSRTELQGDGGNTLGVFGCVGSCGTSPLPIAHGVYTYCRDGGWSSGTGNPCNNANTGVPNGQGTGTYGTMGSWDVSKVDNMRWSKCSLLDFIIANPVYCNILSSRSCLSSACDVIY